jgi:hypothetical protein
MVRLLVLSAILSVELSAQTTASTAQTVTFGVRRISPQVHTAAVVSNAMSSSSLKVTVGSHSRFQSDVELNPANSSQTLSSAELTLNASASNQRLANANRNIEVYSSKSTLTMSSPSGKLLLTLTE